MKFITAFLFVILLVGCKQEAKHDREMLDAQLSQIHIDRVEFISWNREATNVVTGQDAQQILVSLAATNRTEGNEIKDKLRRVYFMNDKQIVLEFSLTENGTWRYGTYQFALRSETH